MKLRHVDLVMMTRRQKSLSKLMEARFKEYCDDPAIMFPLAVLAAGVIDILIVLLLAQIMK